MTNITRRVKTLTNEAQLEHVINIIFGSIMAIGMFTVIVICPIMVNLH